MFFFAPNTPHANYTRWWGQLQRDGSLTKQPESPNAPITLVLVAGDKEQARTLAATSGLDPAQTVFLPDPDNKVTQGVYRLTTTPRVFVLDANGIVRYTNTPNPQTTQPPSALAVVTRALDAIKAAATAEQEPKPTVAPPLIPLEIREMPVDVPAAPQAPPFERPTGRRRTLIPPSPPLPTRAPHPAPATARLTVVASAAVTVPAPDRGQHDFGSVNLLDQSEVAQAFTLKNPNQFPLTITRLQSACDCVSALAEAKTKTGAAPPDATTLAPSDEISLRVALDLTKVAPGAVRKTVVVFAQGQTQPAALLEMTGTVVPAVRFSPPVLDFQRVPVGEASSLALAVTADARLANFGALPPLVSSNPAIQIRPTANKVDAPLERKNSPTVTRNYVLTLAKDTPLGLLSGTVSFAHPVESSGPAPTTVTAPSAVAAALKANSAALAGQVTGDVSAEPQVVAFGMVPLGQQVLREVTITSTRAAHLTDLKISSDSPWLWARMTVPKASAVRPLTQTLEVTIRPNAPAGLLQTRLFIVLANGQKLQLPVTAYISP